MGIGNKERILPNELPRPGHGEPGLDGQSARGGLARVQPRGASPGRRGKGGGPKTAAGKARSSRNAIKHGILSTLDVIPEMESREEWERYREGFIESHQPVGHFEHVLVERLAKFGWRQKRFSRHEDALIAHQVVSRGVAPLIAQAYEDVLEVNAIEAAYSSDTDDLDDDELEEYENSPQHRALEVYRESILREMALIPSAEQREPLMRYEAHLNRQFSHTLHELQALQDRRNGKPAFLGRFDVTTSPIA